MTLGRALALRTHRLWEEYMSRRFEVHGRNVMLALTVVVAVLGCRKGTPKPDTPIAAAVIVPDSNVPAAIAVAVPGDVPVALQVAAPPGAQVVLTDTTGRAVYVLSSACTGDCLRQFTPVAGHSTVKGGDTTVKASLTGSTTAANGSKQATYNGQPLYYYNGDTAPGDEKGAGKKAGGATASLVSPSGSKVSRSGK
jgi:predicted lipoprotein with Yx(FWY)xxD motif